MYKGLDIEDLSRKIGDTVPCCGGNLDTGDVLKIRGISKRTANYLGMGKKAVATEDVYEA